MHSVCMASYNGALYIKKQLESIIKQISEDDEIVIVDDNSSDNTVDIIRKFHDKRIKLILNDENIGVNKTFEKAIYNSRGEIIFLSDQDDVWMDDKYKIIIEYFEKNKEVDAIQHDAKVVDEEMNIVNDSLYDWRGGCSTSALRNFIRGTYVGCCMVCRREALMSCIPFSKIPYHDKWIGVILGLKNYNIKLLDEKLIYYVRHKESTSPYIKKRRGMLIIIRERINFIFDVVKFFLNKK